MSRVLAAGSLEELDQLDALEACLDDALFGGCKHEGAGEAASSLSASRVPPAVPGTSFATLGSFEALQGRSRPSGVRSGPPEGPGRTPEGPERPRRAPSDPKIAKLVPGTAGGRSR